MRLDAGDVVLVRRIEVSDPVRGLTLDQPVGADNAFRTFAQAVVDHQQMVGHGVVNIPVALGAGCLAIGPRPHLLIEHPVAQRLHGVDLGLAGGDPDAQPAAPDFRRTECSDRAD